MTQSVRRMETKRTRVCVKLMSDGRWYSAQRITELTGYRHPNRAITDVRQHGYEVESRIVRTADGKNIVEWRLVSKTPIGQLKRRASLSKSETDAIFRRDNYTCALCRTKYDADFLRVDHREPVSRSLRGNAFSKDEPNWMRRFQTLCQICNYEKREICKKCTRDACLGCELYEPEKYGGLMLRLESEALGRFAKKAQESSVSLQELMRRILLNWLKTSER